MNEFIKFLPNKMLRDLYWDIKEELEKRVELSNLLPYLPKELALPTRISRIKAYKDRTGESLNLCIQLHDKTIRNLYEPIDS